MMTRLESSYLDQPSINEGNKMKIQSVGVIGAGTMGNGIAQVCAVAGLDVVMVDINAVSYTHLTLPTTSRV